MADYTTGKGQKLVNVHRRNEECESGCVIHNPTDPNKHWPTWWDSSLHQMFRECPHGIKHPDKDDLVHISYRRGNYEAIQLAKHECDGCCERTEEDAKKNMIAWIKDKDA